VRGEIFKNNLNDARSTHLTLVLFKVSAVARRVDKGGVTGRGLLRENSVDLGASSGYILYRKFQKT